MIGALSVGFAFHFIFHIRTLSYLADVAAAVHSQSPPARLHLLFSALLSDGWAIIFLAILLGLWTQAAYPRESWDVLPARPWTVLLWLLGAALWCRMGNAVQRSEDPLYLTAAILTIELYRRPGSMKMQVPGSAAQRAYLASVLIILPLVAGGILARDVASLVYATLWDITERPHSDSSRLLHSRYLKDFLVPASTSHVTAYWLARDHAANINDGIDLIRRHLTKDDRVTTLAFTNPFSFALGLPPAKDGNQFWDLGISFDEQHAPPADEYLGSASLVMVPRMLDRSRGAGFETVDVLLRLYGHTLESRFVLVGTSSQWLLYRRQLSEARTPTS
jgi:hypothetical protein